MDANTTMAVRKIKICKERKCNNASTTMGYCRIHYLKNWRKIKEAQKKKALKNLNKYIDHIMNKNPKGYMDVIKEDIRNFDQFNRKAEGYFTEDEFYDVMSEVGEDDVEKIIDSIKIDDSF